MYNENVREKTQCLLGSKQENFEEMKTTVRCQQCVSPKREEQAKKNYFYLFYYVLVRQLKVMK